MQTACAHNRKAPRARAHAVAVERTWLSALLEGAAIWRWRGRREGKAGADNAPVHPPTLTDAELRVSAKQLGATVEDQSRDQMMEVGLWGELGRPLGLAASWASAFVASGGLYMYISNSYMDGLLLRSVSLALLLPSGDGTEFSLS